jgi:protein-tyrosine-phosphatase
MSTTKLAALRALAHRTHRGLRRRLVRACLQLPFVRRRLRRDALAAWSRSQTVAFVCLGNICRSPFAEILARQVVSDDKVVRSAGYFPRSGRQAPPDAVGSALKWGVDLGSHRSRILTVDLIQEADALFVFDADNHRSVLSQHPAARGKVHYMGALAQRGPVEIDDPYGRSVADFERTYRLIARSLTAAREDAPR